MSTTSGTFSLWGSWEQGGEELISSSVRIPSATVIWCAKLMWLVFLMVVFFCFFVQIYSPCIVVFVFTGLCLVPLDGIKISGFVLSCRVAEWASLLLNSMAYALAMCIWMSISALPRLCEHGPLPLEAVCCDRNASNSCIWVIIVDVSSYAASRSHNCVRHFSVELPLSASVTFEYPSHLKAGKMWYFLASYQLIHEVICGKMSAISSSRFFLSLYSAMVVTEHISWQMFLNMPL